MTYIAIPIITQMKMYPTDLGIPSSNNDLGSIYVYLLVY